MPENPNDPLRRAILDYLYELHRTHKGTRGRETEGRAITEAVSKRTGTSLAEVHSNLDYLVSGGFVDVREVPRSLSDGTRVDPRRLYSISAPGIELIEGKSEFSPRGARAAAGDITISNKDGVVTLIFGNGNRVTAGHGDLPAILTALAKIIEANRDLSDAARRDALADLETVRAQSSKSKPDIGIIRTAWEGVKIAVTAGEAAVLLQKAAALLGLP